MPDVNPTVTGYGTNWITEPSRAKPITTSMPPAIIVAIARPPTPWLCTMP